MYAFQKVGMAKLKCFDERSVSDRAVPQISELSNDKRTFIYQTKSNLC